MATKSDLAEVKSELKSEIAVFKSELKIEIASVKSEMADFVFKLGGLIVVCTGVLGFLIKF